MSSFNDLKMNPNPSNQEILSSELSCETMWVLLSHATKKVLSLQINAITDRLQKNKTKQNKTTPKNPTKKEQPKKPKKLLKDKKQQTKYKCSKINKHFKSGVIAPDNNTCLLEQNPLPTVKYFSLLHCRDRIRCYGIVLSKQVDKHKSTKRG